MTNEDLLNEIIAKFKQMQRELSRGNVAGAVWIHNLLRQYIQLARQRGILVGLDEGPVLYTDKFISED